MFVGSYFVTKIISDYNAKSLKCDPLKGLEDMRKISQE